MIARRTFVGTLLRARDFFFWGMLDSGRESTSRLKGGFLMGSWPQDSVGFGLGRSTDSPNISGP
jgi:hypothetical protein